MATAVANLAKLYLQAAAQALSVLEGPDQQSEAIAHAKEELATLLQHLMAGTVRQMQLENELRQLEGITMVRGWACGPTVAARFQVFVNSQDLCWVKAYGRRSTVVETAHQCSTCIKQDERLLLL